MRAFVCSFLDKEGRDYFRDLKQKLAKEKRALNFVGLDQIHLTYKFLGDDIDQEIYEYYSDTLEAKISDMKKFEIELLKPRLGFGRQIVPRVVASLLKPNDNVVNLIDIAHDAGAGISKWFINTTKERNKHTSHITIARTKRTPSSAYVKDLNAKLLTLEPPGFPLKIGSVSIVESKLTATGPIYRTLKEIELK